MQIFDGLIRDLRLAARKLARRPGFTLVAVASLALGIGANTAIFSVVDTVLLRSLPYAEPERIVRVWETFPYPGGRGSGSVSVPNLRDWQEQSRSFEALGAYSQGSFNLMGQDAPLQVSGTSVTPEVFRILGVEPLLGRGLEPTDNGTLAIVFSHQLWQSFYGADPGIVGQDVRVGGEAHTVIGVMPDEFRFPPRSTSQLWTTLDIADDENRGSHWLAAVARLAPGVTLDAAQSDMDVIARRLEQEYPDQQEARGVGMLVLADLLVEKTRPVLLALWGAVGFVLLIACGNVANLLLARAAERRREFAVRAALGAERSRLVRQMLFESLLLALTGGVLGLLIGYLALDYLAALPGTSLPAGQEVAFDWRVLLVSLATALLAAGASGLVPALRASRTDLQDTMRDRSSTPSAGSHRDPVRSALVMAEIALALVVLIGAGLVLRSLMSLQAVDSGLRTEDVLTLRVPLPIERYDQPEAIVSFYDRLRERVDALPGVESNGLINLLPIQSWGWNGEFHIAGHAPLPSGQQPFAEYRRVAGEYFQTMDIPLLAGRFFDGRDHAEAPVVALVNQTLASRYWGEESPIGQRIGWDPEAPPEDWVTIVGVVGDVKNAGLATETRGDMYFPHAQATLAEMTLVVRSSIEGADLAAMIRSEVRALDPEQPIFRVATMDAVLADFLASWRFNAVLFTVFAALALVLAMLGVYGVLSYNVSQRTYEIGLRMALGAGRRSVLWLIVRQGLVLAAAGAALGVAAATGVTHLLANRLYGVEPVDLPTFGAVTALLLMIATVACLVPARRASSVEPVIALRYE